MLRGYEEDAVVAGLPSSVCVKVCVCIQHDEEVGEVKGLWIRSQERREGEREKKEKR